MEWVESWLVCNNTPNESLGATRGPKKLRSHVMACSKARPSYKIKQSSTEKVELIGQNQGRLNRLR